MADAVLNVFRGNKDSGETVDYKVPIAPGMVVPRRAALYPGTSFTGSCGAVELQGREVRFVFG